MPQRQALPGRVIFVIGLAVLLNYVDRGNLATAAPLLQDELSLSSSEVGVLLSAFFWVYAPAQLLAGWLAHRFDIRIVLAAGVALWSVATALTGLAGGFASILALRLLLGLGESVTFPCWLLILARHSAEHERGRANGFVSSGQGFGPMLGTLFGGLAMAHFGWRAMFLGLGTITLLWLWPWFAVTRNTALHAADGSDPRQVSYLEILQQREFLGRRGRAVPHQLRVLLRPHVAAVVPRESRRLHGVADGRHRRRNLRHLCRDDGACWSGVRSLDPVMAARATRVRKMFLLVAASGSAVTIACCALVPPHAAVWFLGITAVFFGLSTPMIFAVGATLAGPRAAGRWGGAQNLAGQLAGIVSPIVTGLIVDRTGGYSLAFAVAAAAALLSMVAWGVVIRQVVAVQWSGESAPLVEPIAHAAR